ncbi:OmpA family protein [Microvirga terricola]|uniref:OmpA family protein n=1 Tax=Microvirga terricola TaxID=2719797 RepID=UPI0031BAC9C5
MTPEAPRTPPASPPQTAPSQPSAPQPGAPQPLPGRPIPPGAQQPQTPPPAGGQVPTQGSYPGRPGEYQQPPAGGPPPNGQMPPQGGYPGRPGEYQRPPAGGPQPGYPVPPQGGYQGRPGEYQRPGAPMPPSGAYPPPQGGEYQRPPVAGAPVPSMFPGGNIDDLRRQRRERAEDGGRRVIIQEPGDRTIIREGNRLIIRHDETDRFRQSYGGADFRVQQRGANQVTIIRQPNGEEIVTERDVNGNLIRRIRRDPYGREVILIQNEMPGRPRFPYGYLPRDVMELPPPVIAIPRERYIVDVESASEDDLYEAFSAPPVMPITRAYTLDEIRQSQMLRERVRRVDVDTVTFDSGSWTLAPDQWGALTGIGTAIQRVLQQNPNEIFLVEGYTDAVGADEDNLSLSDRRAETVATILTQRFGIPAENLTTQGYGEQYLKINTQGPERRNRRVTIRRITPLLQGQQR